MNVCDFVLRESGNKLVSRIESIVGHKPSSGDDLVSVACKLRNDGAEDYYEIFVLASKLKKADFYDDFNYQIVKYEVDSKSDDISTRINKLNSMMNTSCEMFYCEELICLYLSVGMTSKAKRLLVNSRSLLGNSNILELLWSDIQNGSENYRDCLKKIESQRECAFKGDNTETADAENKDNSNNSDSSISNKLTVSQTIKNNGKYSETVENAFVGIIGMDVVKEQLDKIYKRIVLDIARSKVSEDYQDNKGYHFILCGNPGTGKTTVARIIAKLLHQIGVLGSGAFVETDRAGLVGEYIGHTEKNIKQKIANAMGGVLFIDEAYNLFEEDSDKDFGKHVIETLLKDMEDNRGKYSVILAGYKQPMDNMMKKANVGFSSRFDYHINIPDYSDDDLYEILLSMAETKHFIITEDSKPIVYERIKRERIDETFDNARFMRRLLDYAIENQAERLNSRGKIKEDELFVLISDDFALKNKNDDTRTLDDYLNQLDQMIGLEPIKLEIKSQIDSIIVQNARKNHGLSVGATESGNHMIFSGNPGTGKTTVARLYGKILTKLGVLKRENVFVECKRADLVGEWQGHTAAKTMDLIKTALGGVLFIDEAYDLVHDKHDSFGIEALTTLLAEMENKRDRLVVILAGYTDKMDNLMDNNPGIRSRISKVIEFPDYSSDELVEIFYFEMKRRGYSLDLVDSIVILELIDKQSKKRILAMQGVCETFVMLLSEI